MMPYYGRRGGRLAIGDDGLGAGRLDDHGCGNLEKSLKESQSRDRGRVVKVGLDRLVLPALGSFSWVCSSGVYKVLI